jgi:tetratricopeptide (TPR) repeat protein
LRKLLFFLVLFNLLALRVVASKWGFDTTCQEAYQATLNLQFEKASQLLADFKAESEPNACVALIENYQDFLQIFILEEESVFKAKESNRKSRLKQLEALPDHEPFKKWSLAVVNLQWAFSRLKFKEYFTSALEIRKAYFLLKANQEHFPDFAPNLLGAGLLNAILGTVPPEYTWALDMAGMEGSIQQGRMQLWQLAQLAKEDKKNAIWLPETLFYLSFIEINLSTDTLAAQRVMEELKKINDKTPLLLYAEANLLMRNGKNDDAEKLLEVRGNFEMDIPFFYLDYLYAETLSRKLDQRAIIYFQKYEASFRGINYKADALRKIAWMDLIKGDTSNYLQALKAVRKYSKVQVDADKQAIYDAENQIIYHPELLRSRLLFDGGYYQQAEAVLEAISPSGFQEKDLIEYHYRQGRVADRLAKQDAAIQNYKQTILLGGKLPYYYAANAALKLGELYEIQNNADRAINAYEKCLGMKPDNYRISIHQKAKAGLNRLQKK